MPFNGSGVYSPPSPPAFPATAGELIKASDFNEIVSDIATALTNCVTKDNQSTVPALTLTSLTVSGTSTLGASSTVGGEQILTRRYTTGEIVSSVSPTAPVGTILLNGGTIGSTASGATTRANNDTQALFELLWTLGDNTLLPIQDAVGAATTRGLTAAADFAANKRLPIPSMLEGETLVAGFAAASLTHTVGNVISHQHTITIDAGGAHQHVVRANRRRGADGDSYGAAWDGGNVSLPNTDTTTSDPAGSHTHTGTANAVGGTLNKAAGFFVKFYIAL